MVSKDTAAAAANPFNLSARELAIVVYAFGNCPKPNMTDMAEALAYTSPKMSGQAWDRLRKKIQSSGGGEAGVAIPETPTKQSQKSVSPRKRQQKTAEDESPPTKKRKAKASPAKTEDDVEDDAKASGEDQDVKVSGSASDADDIA